MTVPVHDAQHLLADVLRSPERASLDEVLVAPRVRELVVLPRVVDGQQGEMVALGLMELGLLLVRQGLLVLCHTHTQGEKKVNDKCR